MKFVVGAAKIGGVLLVAAAVPFVVLVLVLGADAIGEHTGLPKWAAEQTAKWQAAK